MALNLKQKLLGAYFLVEEQYYDVVDALENRGRYEFTDYFVTPIEEKGVPSFVVFLAIVLLLFLGIFFLFFQPAPTTASFEVRLYNALTNERVDGFVTIERGGRVIAAEKTAGGRVSYDKMPRAQIDVRAESEGFEEFAKTVDAGKTRTFTARLKPLGAQNANALLLQQIAEPPPNAQLPPLPTFEPPPWESPTPPGGEASATPSATPLVSPSPSAKPTATPIRQSEVVLAVGNQTEFEGFIVKLKDLTPSGSMIRIDLLNATTPQRPIFEERPINVNSSIDYELLTIWFLGAVNETGTLKAKLLLQIFGAAPSPSPSPPPALFVRIEAPKNGEPIYDALERVNITAAASDSITSVEVSTDNGSTWKNASAALGGAGKWTFDWLTPPSGEIPLKARARTSGGMTAEAAPVRVFVSPCKKLYYSGEGAQKIDLVFAPSKYSDSLEFKSDADAALVELFAKKPFSGDGQKRSEFNVWYYAYNFECSLLGGGRMWDCVVPDNYNASCTMADVTAVIVKSSDYAGSAAPGARLLAFSSVKPELFPHELGHALFGLADRYCCDGGYWEAAPKPNLWAAVPPCSDYVSQLLGIDVECRRIRSYLVGVGGAQANWFEQPADSHMQKPEFDFDESDVARINHVLATPAQETGGG